LIRVAVLADTLLHAQSLADLLADDDRIEVIDVRAISRAGAFARTSLVDVLVAVRLSPDQIHRSDSPLIVLTDGPADESAFAREIRAWLPLNAPPVEIAAAIIAAANELSVLTQDQVRRWLRNSLSHGQQDTFVETLTPRELQVLRMLADGVGNKEIAGQLGISEHTAKFHVAQILAKLGAASRTEAVTIGIRRGLVPI
jgi:DNA-binding NarL/FixJ family response regulator